MPSPKRRRTKASRGSDALLSYIVPLFFMALAGYQEITDHHVDKYVIGGLLVFGLGALGYRIDSLFERYLETKAGAAESSKGDDG